MDSTGGLWESAYQSVSGSISICHVYSSGVLAHCSAKSPSFQPANRERKQKPTHCCYRLNPLYYVLSLNINLFFQSLLVTFPASGHLILPHLSQCSTFHSPLLEWIWSESSLNRISTDLTKKGLDLPQHMLPFFPVKWQSVITIQSISSSCSLQLLLWLQQELKM